MSSSAPVDVETLRTDESGEVDLEQIEHNLLLTPEQRLQQYFDWLEFMQIARQAGRQYYGMELRAVETSD